MYSPRAPWLDCFSTTENQNAQPRLVKHGANLFRFFGCHGVQASTHKSPYIKVLFGNILQPALLDSGAVRSLVSWDFYLTLLQAGQIRDTKESDITCRTASQSPLLIDCIIKVKIKLDGFSWYWNFLVAKNLGLPCIIGADFISSSQLVMDLAARQIYFKFKRNWPVKLFYSIKEAEMSPETVCELAEQPTEVEVDPLKHLSDAEATTIRSLAARFPDVLTTVPGMTPLIEYEIRLTNDKPVRSHPYKLSPPKMEEMRRMVNELLEQGVIEVSKSTYSSPAFWYLSQEVSGAW